VIARRITELQELLESVLRKKGIASPQVEVKPEANASRLGSKKDEGESGEVQSAAPEMKTNVKAKTKAKAKVEAQVEAEQAVITDAETAEAIAAADAAAPIAEAAANESATAGVEAEAAVEAEEEAVPPAELFEAAQAADADAAASNELKKGFKMVDAVELVPKDLAVQPVQTPRDAPVARLSHTLPRVLFSPGVHMLRDPRTGVWNFPRELGWIPTPEQFAFDRLPQYVTASEDTELAEMAELPGIEFFGSTSTLTKALSQIYFALSGDKPVDMTYLSRAFEGKRDQFTAGAQLPAALLLRRLPNGRYAVDNNKEYDIDENILSDYGRILEKHLTSDTRDFKRFLKSSPEEGVSQEERTAREAYCYSRGSKLLMRSQLDCQDGRLPGNGTFDIKTRACNAIRHDRANYIANSAADVSQLQGLEDSFEREYYDLTRSGMLKFSLQARIGQMDGIFLAYHNTQRYYGFQYLPLTEIDQRLFGNSEVAQLMFNVSVAVFERILEEAIKMYPGEDIKLFVQRSKRHYTYSGRLKDLVVIALPVETDPAAEQRPPRAIRIEFENYLSDELQTDKVLNFFPDEEKTTIPECELIDLRREDARRK
jgi:hypothetical protein